jgi:hypothetical protein
MTPTLKAHGTKRLKLNCDHPLSNFAFNFNLRCYTAAGASFVDLLEADPAAPGGSLAPFVVAEAGAYTRSLFSST